jgi:general nucleoside transport system ATP-binding protein
MPLPDLLEMRHITKRFGDFLANDDISIGLKKGEIHAILGENGAGKSTLMKILYGAQKADRGEMVFDGVSGFFPSPRIARKMGIAMVYQHFSLFEGMNVLENIALGLDEPLDFDALRQRVMAIEANYSLPLNLDRFVYTLSVGERQRIEIMRCLLQKPKLMIMDEPTSVLTPREVEGLFQLLFNLRNEGCSILYISHKLHEIKAICDSASVLRAGKLVASLDPKTTSTAKMAEIMIGAPVRPLEKAKPALGAIALEVDDLSLDFDDPFATDLHQVSFRVQRGEILGLAGVSGNGQSELALALSGEIAVEPDKIRLAGAAIGHLPPDQRRRKGLLTLPEERNGHAAIPEMSLAENTLLTARDRQNLHQNGVLNPATISAFTKAIIATFDVRTRGENAMIKSLSGGNIQKFIMGREILQNPDVLVVSQPTWGVDAGAASHIRQQIIALAASGKAVIVFSQDLDELFEISDQLAVLSGGRLSALKPVADWTTEEIGLAMAGLSSAREAASHQEAGAC